MTISAYAIPGIKECDREALFGVDAKVNRIIEKVASYYSITETQMKSKSRRRQVVTARHLCIYFLRLNTQLSLKYIGNLFGGRDHTTVLNSLSVVKSQLSIKVDTEMKSDYQYLISII